jgi:hypothetical protein
MSVFEMNSSHIDTEREINVFKINLPSNDELQTPYNFHGYVNKLTKEEETQLNVKEDSLCVIINPVIDANTNIIDNISIAYNNSI